MEVLIMPLQESGEMYLVTIQALSKDGAPVRSLDIARHMGYSRASISRAMKILRDEGYITVDETGYLFLTDKGLKIAESINEKHVVLRDFLTSIGVDKKTADSDACRIEHVISDRSLKALKKHNEKLKKD